MLILLYLFAGVATVLVARHFDMFEGCGDDVENGFHAIMTVIAWPIVWAAFAFVAGANVLGQLLRRRR